MLSVRAGNIRRQAPLEFGRPLRFPAESTACEEIQVDILALLGRGKLDLRSATGTYDVHLDPINGHPTMSCEMEVRCKPRATASRPPAGLTAGCKSSRRHEAVMSATKYMESCGLVLAVQQAMHMTVTDRPDDPLKYMADQLLRLAVEAKAIAAEEGSFNEEPGSQQGAPPGPDKPESLPSCASRSGLADNGSASPYSSAAWEPRGEGASREEGANLPQKGQLAGQKEPAEACTPAGEPALKPPSPSTCVGSASLSQAEHGTILGELESDASAQECAGEAFHLALSRANQALEAHRPASSESEVSKPDSSTSGSCDTQILVTNPSTNLLGTGFSFEELEALQAASRARTAQETPRFEPGNRVADGEAWPLGTVFPPPPRASPLPPPETPPMLPPRQASASSAHSDGGYARSSSIAVSVHMVEDDEQLAAAPVHHAVARDSLNEILEARDLFPMLSSPESSRGAGEVARIARPR